MRFFLVSILVLLSLLIHAQVYERYREETEEKHYPRKLSIVWANDVFFQTDRYFTNGLEVDYHTQNLDKLAIAGILLDPMSESGPIFSLTLRHDIFTPKNVIGNPLQTDRPYAGVLMLGIKSEHFSSTKHYRFSSEIGAGLLGEYAGGQFVQNGIHVLLPASEPIPGWAYQIRHTLLLQYNTGFEKGIFDSDWIAVDALAGARLGLPYTDFSGGMRIRVGKAPDYFSADHLLSRSHNFVYFFAESRLRTILYDATLQGGMFTDKNPHTIVDTNPLTGEWKAGIAVRYANLQAEAGARMYTPRFRVAVSHKWVFFKIGILF